MRRFKIGDTIIRTDEKSLNKLIEDDFEARIGDIATITKFADRYNDSYIVKYHRRDSSIWDDKNCRKLTKLEKALK